MNEPRSREQSAGNQAACELWHSIKSSINSRWWGELPLVALSGVGGAFFAIAEPDRVKDFVAVAAAIVGVIIGAVVAGMAILTAGFDRSFIRIAHWIDNEFKLVTSLSPFLFSATLGILSVFVLPIWAALPVSSHALIRALCGIFATAFSCWTLASLIPALGTLIAMVDIIQKAARMGIDDEIARAVIIFLEDRCLLFGNRHVEDEAHCVSSALECCTFLTKQIAQTEPGKPLETTLKSMRAAFRQFVERGGTHGHKFQHRRFTHEADPFSLALGDLRTQIGEQLARIAGRYNVKIDDELARILPPEDDGTDLSIRP